MQFKIGNETVRAYKRLPYTSWHAIAEFIDNSTQAYFDNASLLDPIYQRNQTKLNINVLFDHKTRTLTVHDTSIGMNLEEVEQALEVGTRPPRPTGRSKYGLGLKTAACWFGASWQIKTKRLGETKEITVVVDVERIASGDSELNPIIVDTTDPDSHYTELTIYNLYRRLPPKTLTKIERYLASMYRYDIQDGLVDLFFQNSPLEWAGFDSRILTDSDGNMYKKSLDFTAAEREIHGWVAVLGSGGREIAGFTILQNRRVIRGYPENWRPTTLFGQVQGSNDTVNQRLIGEIHLDGFEVTHTKDDIVWAGEEEEAVEDALLDLCRDYRTIANTPYKAGDEREPESTIVDAAIDQLVRDLKSDELVDKIELVETPPEEVIDTTFRAVVDQQENQKPRIDLQVGSRQVRLHLSYTSSFNDPYIAIDITPDEVIIVVINMRHPYIKFLNEPAAMTDYIRNCAFDALATDKARIQKGRVHYNTVLLHKDGLLRVPHEIHDLGPEFDKDE